MDVLNMDLRQHESQVYGKERLCRLVCISICVTYFVDGKILALVGYMEKWAGVLEVFVIPSIHVPQHGHVFVRMVKRALDELFECLPIHRMESSAWATKASDKWMETLGFTCEGTLVNYTPEKITYKMWARYS